MFRVAGGGGGGGGSGGGGDSNINNISNLFDRQDYFKLRLINHLPNAENLTNFLTNNNTH